MQYLLPLMSDGASIILNGTTSAAKGIPGAGVYSASKAAVRSLTRTGAAERIGGTGVDTPDRQVEVIADVELQDPGWTCIVPSDPGAGSALRVLRQEWRILISGEGSSHVVRSRAEQLSDGVGRGRQPRRGRAGPARRCG